MTPEVPAAVERALRPLALDDPARAWVELVFEAEDPAVTLAVVRKLVSEARAEQGGPRTVGAAGGQEVAGGRQPRGT